MFFDFCVGPPGASGAPCGLDTIFWIWGDSSYQTPHKGITPGKTYLVFTLKGEGLVRYDGRAYRVAQDQALVMRPTRDFGYGCPGDTWHFWWFELCQPQSCLEEDRVLCVRAGDFVQRLFQHSLICAKQGRWDIAQSLFLPALMLLGQDVGKSGTVPEALLRAEHYIRENLATVTVAAVCKELDIQKRSLRNLCHRALGYGPKRLISRIRLETAQQLLSNTTMPLCAIASMLGYNDPFHFSRSFREYYHIPPSEYRRRASP